MLTGGQFIVSILPFLGLAIVDGHSGLDRPVTEPVARCVDIPVELTACRRFGYTQMRLPNLFNHSTTGAVRAAVSHGDDWTSLAATGQCGQDAALLVCSLLSPVCLDHPIRPCGSLCDVVRRQVVEDGVCQRGGSDGVTRHSWPAELLDCSQLPSDSVDVCIAASRRNDSIMTTYSKDRRSRPTSTPEYSRRHPFSKSLTDTTGSVSRRATSAPLNRRTTETASQRIGKWKSKPHVERSRTSNSSCAVCESLFSAGDQLLDVLCEADFIAKVQPDRYIRFGANMKMIASRKIRYYPSLKPGASIPAAARRTAFFVHAGAACRCFSADGSGSDEFDDNFLVVGHLERGRHERLVLTGALPFKSRLVARRVLRAVKSQHDCPVVRGRDLMLRDEGQGRLDYRRTARKKLASKGQRAVQRRGKTNREDTDVIAGRYGSNIRVRNSGKVHLRSRDQFTTSKRKKAGRDRFENQRKGRRMRNE